MDVTRLSKFAYAPLVAAILFLALGYSLDRVNFILSQNIDCIMIFNKCRLVHIGLSGLFAIASVLYIALLLSTRAQKLLALLVSLTLSILTILWQFFGYLLLSNLNFLRSIHLVANLSRTLSASGPDSYLTLSALIVGLGVSLAILHSAKRTST